MLSIFFLMPSQLTEQAVFRSVLQIVKHIIQVFPRGRVHNEQHLHKWRILANQTYQLLQEMPFQSLRAITAIRPVEYDVQRLLRIDSSVRETFAQRLNHHAQLLPVVALFLPLVYQGS